MLYYNNEYVKGAALECAEYVMANTAPSHVTGNTAYGRFLNEDRINKFCDECIKYLCKKLNVVAHGVLSFDLKEDRNGNMKVTEVNIRHMAYTGVMAQVGFDLIEDTIRIMENGDVHSIKRHHFFIMTHRMFFFETLIQSLSFWKVKIYFIVYKSRI